MQFSDAERVKTESADALAPAGYGVAAAGDDFGFGEPTGDFNFGGEEFGGGDFNSAFDEVSANPAAASDDPFDLDFFNQGTPKDEPGAGHAQKEGEESTPPPSFSFDFGDLDASLAAPANSPAEPAPVAATPAPAPVEPAFDFSVAPPSETGAPNASTSNTPIPPEFDFSADFSDDLLPAVATPEDSTPVASTEKRTAQLEDFSFDASDTTPVPVIENTPAAPTSPLVSAGFADAPSANAIPSAFDFDNFDLPGVEKESSSPVAAPVTPEPAPLAPAATAFALDVAPSPTPKDTQPAPFDFDDTTLASQNDTAPKAAAPAFDFSLPEPTPAPAQPVVAAPNPLIETTPVAPPSSDFDLDDIFGAPTASSAEGELQSAGIESGTGEASPVLAEANSDANFDLSDIDTGPDNGFAAGFGTQSDDFSAFGAGLAEGGASTDAATLYSLIQPSLEELSNEVRRSIEFHLGRYPDSTISRLILLGGGAKLRNLDVFFTQTLGVPTVVGNPFSHIKVQTPSLPPEYATDNGPLCAVALGLALRDFVE
jgi:hypothetical protein